MLSTCQLQIGDIVAIKKKVKSSQVKEFAFSDLPFKKANWNPDQVDFSRFLK